MNDLKFAFRQLLKNPGFTAVAVLTLALGIGANTAIFNLVNAVLLRPMAVQKPEEIVSISASTGPTGPPELSSYLDYLEFRNGSRDVLTGVAAVIVIDDDDFNPGRDIGDVLHQSPVHSDVDGFHVSEMKRPDPLETDPAFVIGFVVQ